MNHQLYYIWNFNWLWHGLIIRMHKSVIFSITQLKINSVIYHILSNNYLIKTTFLSHRTWKTNSNAFARLGFWFFTHVHSPKKKKEKTLQQNQLNKKKTKEAFFSFWKNRHFKDNINVLCKKKKKEEEEGVLYLKLEKPRKFVLRLEL